MFRKLSLLLLAAGTLFLLPSNAKAQSEKIQKIQASYMLAFGRMPDGGEVNYWNGQADKSLRDHLTNHAKYAHDNPGEKRKLIAKSYLDAMGRNPTEAEVQYWLKGNDLYYNLMKNHINWLGGNPAEYEKVIKRSYQTVLGRQPDAGEIAYWKNQGTLSYVTLLACHEQWKKTNGAAAKKTSGNATIGGSSATSLATTTVSQSVANDVKSATGIQPGGNVIAAGGGNAIAPGGFVIAAGGANVVAAGGLN